jgi:hypothetical protein
LSRSEPQILETKTVDNCSLRVSFVWNRDRYSHSIAILHDGQLIPLLESSDDNNNTAWPASPPLQQLSIEPRADGSQIAFLVGMSGKSHWSASIAPLTDSVGFEFDFAVRIPAAPGFVGSGYRTMIAPKITDSPSFELALENWRCEIRPADATQLSLESLDNGISLRCLETATRFPATLRWKYFVSVRRR